jgi:hypothetical protein
MIGREPKNQAEKHGRAHRFGYQPEPGAGLGRAKPTALLVTSRSQEEQEECSLAITGHLSLRS